MADSIRNYIAISLLTHSKAVMKIRCRPLIYRTCTIFRVFLPHDLDIAGNIDGIISNINFQEIFA